MSDSALFFARRLVDGTTRAGWAVGHRPFGSIKTTASEPTLLRALFAYVRLLFPRASNSGAKNAG